MMKGFFTKKISAMSASAAQPPQQSPQEDIIFLGYESDTSDSSKDSDEEDNTPNVVSSNHEPSHNPNNHPTFCVQAPPPLKHHRLEVPAQTAHLLAKENQHRQLAAALEGIKKVIESKCYVFAAGHNGLQASRT